MRTLSWSTIFNAKQGLFALAVVAIGLTSQLTSLPANAYSADAFVMEVDTTKVSPTNTVFVVPTNGSGYNYTIDCDDTGPMTSVSGQTGNYTCQYAIPGIYSVVITGEFPEILFGSYFETPIHRLANATQLIGIKQWGSQQWRSMSAAFRYTENLVINASDTPDMSKVTSTSCMFCEATNFTGDLSDWDVSNVSDMANMFNGAPNFNSDLSNWTVSNVTDMSGMFYNYNSHAYNSKFNADLSEWDVSSVQYMDNMFRGAHAFTSNLSEWNVGNVKTMEYMFGNAQTFTSDLSSWDVGNVTNMKGMFASAYNFNSNVSEWNVGNVTTMEYMFLSAYKFTSSLSNWDVGNVTNMSRMFDYASNFNTDVSEWNVGNVTNMSGMFRDAAKFNQDISNWDVSKVTDMSDMLYNARSFNQLLNQWDVSKVTSMESMLNGSGMSQANYETTLNGWAAQSVQPGVALGADGLSYCDNTGRDMLTSTPKNWTISGDYWCNASPIIESVSPSEVTATNKPLEITIEGSGFLPNSTVTIDGIEVESVGYNSYSKSLRAVVTIWTTTTPGGHDVTVTNPGGQQFTLINALTVNAPSPKIQEARILGPYNNGMLVAVSVQDYVEGAEFWFGDVQIEPMVVQYDDWDEQFVAVLEVPTPEDLDEETTVDITMSGLVGQPSILKDAYTYTPRFDTITGVSFSPEGDSMIVHGNNLFKYYLDIYEEMYGLTLENTPEEAFMQEFGGQFMYGMTKPVTINGITPGFCTNGLGMTENEATPFFDGTSTASDTPPCYLLLDAENQELAFSNSQFKILLPDGFDTKAQGTISILGSKTFTFNKGATPSPSTDQQLLVPVDTHTTVAQPLRAATLGVRQDGDLQSCNAIDTAKTRLLSPNTAEAPAGTTLLGGVGFELTCDEPGGSALVSLRLGVEYEDPSTLSAYKDLTGNGTLTQVDVTFVNRDGATYVEFPLTDGLTNTPTGLIDEDGEADGRIVDPLYIAVASGTPTPTQPGSTIPDSPGAIPGASLIERALGTNSSSLLAPNSGLQRLETKAKEWLWPIALVIAVVTGGSILLTTVALRRSRRSAYTS